MNVLLTGGSRGIGEATVRRLHRDGHRVLFTYNSGARAAAQICSDLGEGVFREHCDLADHDKLPDVVTACAKRLGSIDVLINNAATYAENGLEGTSYDAWRRGWEQTFAVNIFAAAHLCFLTIPLMRAQGRGRIINVSSRSAHRGEVGFADYGASKAALVNLTKSIARSCARDGIAAVAIAPGFIETEMAAAQLEERRAEIEAEIPGRRVGTPQEVAEVIAFFASGAGDYATGSTIDLNGASYVR